MTIAHVDVWHLEYYNVPTKTCGIACYHTEKAAIEAMKALEVWTAYVCMHVTGPHLHEVVKE